MTSVLNSRALYDIYTVEIVMRDRLYGGIPRNKDLIKTWVEATTGHADAQAEEITAAAMEQMVDNVAEKSWIGFFRDEQKGLYLESRCLKAAIKQCASVLGLSRTKRGSKQILHEGAEVKATDGGDKLWLGKQEPDGIDERPIHVMTPQGPRTALKRGDYVENVKLEFEVWVLWTQHAETRHIGEEDLRMILALAQENGIGADRSQGKGKFDVTKFEKISTGLARSVPEKKDAKRKGAKEAVDEPS